MKRYILLLTFFSAMTAMGQGRAPIKVEPYQDQNDGILSVPDKKDSFFGHAFNHLDLSLTTGSTGIGFDLSMPLNDLLALRAGYAIMPHFSHRMHFGVQVGDDPATSDSKFARLAALLQDFTGNKVDNVVDMMGKPTYWNWKLLVDVTPFRNKHWHLTAGIFAGNKQVAEAVNAIEDMPSLMAVSIYNNMFFRARNDEPMLNVGDISVYNLELQEKLKNYGMMSIQMGDYAHDILYEEDVVAEERMMIGDDIYQKGDIIHHKGDVMIAKGSPYRMTPDENSMVKAYAYANRIKPYVGFGYGGQLIKGNDRWHVSFDCGAMFWGGIPKIVTHDGTDLVNDVDNVRGKVGDYVDIIKKFHVFPVLNLRVTRRIF